MEAVNDKTNLVAVAAERYFLFLKQDYGFAESILRPHEGSLIIRYVNSKVYVNVLFGPPEYEVEMSFGRLDIDDIEGEYSFEAGDLVQLQSYKIWNFEQQTSDALENQIAWFASLLRHCGAKCLSGGEPSFAAMKARREIAITQWRDDEAQKRLTAQFDEAWRAKDYCRVVELGEAAYGHLSDVNLKKLRIAKRKNTGVKWLIE